MARRRDSQALIWAWAMRQFQEKVVAPALNQLQSIPRDLVGGPRASLVQMARDNTYNTLCDEMRLGFALTVGAAFERNLRLWLSLCRADLRPMIERADRIRLFEYVAEVKGPIAGSMIQAVDLVELWELVSTARHGDGPSAKRLRAHAPSLWSHQDLDTRDAYDRVGLRAHSLRVQDNDIARYFDAVIGFWEGAGRR